MYKQKCYDKRLMKFYYHSIDIKKIVYDAALNLSATLAQFATFQIAAK